jgi:uncharacterized protein
MLQHPFKRLSQLAGVPPLAPPATRAPSRTAKVNTHSVSGWVGILLIVAASAPARAESFPPAPGGENFIYDSAKLLRSGDEARIADAQHEAFALHDTPIVVVTIYRMSDYTPRPLGIEGFARRWFDTWGIGKAGSNKGILVLVSEGDRQARIELGGDWGHGWDTHARRIMDRTIIPAFKEGDYSRGIQEGVKALAEMAAGGPRGQPPRPGVLERLESSDAAKTLAKTSAFPRNTLIYMVIGGALLIVASFFFPEHRKMLLLIGFGLIAVALFTWIVVVIIGLISRGRRGRGSGGVGGGFGGGSSGGGGASGSW